MIPARVEFAEACAFVAERHRHHDPSVGHRFSIGAEHNGRLIGVATIGRPVASGIPKREVVEVNRCCHDGTPNAGSFLYGLAARVARDLGFRALVTYTLTTESGASLRAAGWWPEVLDERSDSATWATDSRNWGRQAVMFAARHLAAKGSGRRCGGSG